jgi:hypothetical protein
VGREAQGDAGGEAQRGDTVESLLVEELHEEAEEEQVQQRAIASKREIVNAVKRAIIAPAHDPNAMKVIVKLMQQMGVSTGRDASEIIQRAFGGMSRNTKHHLPPEVALASWLRDSVRMAHRGN